MRTIAAGSWSAAAAISVALLAVAALVQQARRSTADEPKPQQDVRPAAPEATTPIRDEHLFENWPEPQVALFITGQQSGYIEPCGCAGLANQLGGLARRFTALEQLRARGWHVVAIDAGNQVRRFGQQAQIKFQITQEALRQMKYQSITFGADDLRLPAFDLASILAGLEQKPNPFVGANVTIVDDALTSRYQVIEAAGQRVGLTAVLGTHEQQRVTDGDVVMAAPAARLGEVWPKLEAARCDLTVLVVQGSLEESRELARAFPRFDLVISSGGAGEPTLTPEPIEGTRAVMVQTGTKGMYAGVVGLFEGQPPKLRYQRMPLDRRYRDARPMLQLLAAYQKQLESLGLAGLGLRPIAHPSGRTFVGSEACQSCHSKAFTIWKEGTDKKGGPHARALESLVHPRERSEVPRHFDPECLSCHVTGWNPQRYLPYISGYLGREKTPGLGGSGCENCHGPGSAHVAAENGDVDVSEAELKKLEREMRLPLTEAERKCMECHDLDNSPEFHVRGAFERYWKRIEH